MVSQYFFTASMPASPNTCGLLAQLQAAGLPAVDVQTSDAYPGQVIVVCSPQLTGAQSTQMGNLVTAWDPRPRTKRPIYAIYNDLAALTTTQQGNVWADLSAGTSPKYLLDSGPNAAAIAALDWVVRSSGAAGAALLGARLRTVAMYVQDNVSYLVFPAFDATINVSGDMPA
jgi:hypothetical protein